MRKRLLYYDEAAVGKGKLTRPSVAKRRMDRESSAMIVIFLASERSEWLPLLVAKTRVRAWRDFSRQNVSFMEMLCCVRPLQHE
jgi:hypothetical protein